MKIEDIKPGDVIVRTEDKILFKVVEVTPEGEIMQSANYSKRQNAKQSAWAAKLSAWNGITEKQRNGR